MELVPYSKPNLHSKSTNLPWSEMFRSASASAKRPPQTSDPQPKPRRRDQPSPDQMDPHARLALYIAMAHAGLAFSIFLLYGLYRLLHDFIRPILWAVLCSIPLREVQNTIVYFWSEPLSRGLTDTFLAVPAAIFRVSSATLIDIRQACVRSISRKKSDSPAESCESVESSRFEKLVQWLVSFGVFVISYEILGLGAVVMFGLIFLFADPKAVAVVRNASFVRTSKSRFRFVTRVILERLETAVAIGLIFALIAGVIVGGVFFSYKIGVESKDAVISIKTHVQESNYAERIGFKNWMDQNDIPGIVDQYSGKLYETAWEQIDSMADQYNLTEFANGLKQFFSVNTSTDPSEPSSTALSNNAPIPYAQKLHSLSNHLKNREWMEIYTTMDSILRELLIARVDLVEKTKVYALEWIRVSKRILAGSGSLIGGSASVLFSIGLSVLSGAVEVLNFVSQSMVFFSLLYYLITSKSGGATEQAISMVPISTQAKERCVEVINLAISSVLLATAKIAFFQGSFTWLLFRFFDIHFLYGSTILALLSPLLPVFPTWVSSLPALVQLVVEGRYVLAVLLSVLHLVLMDYGVSAILEDVPGHNAYITGLSVLGGIALFHSVLEGAIMGPLIMALVISLKNLYAEFVLGDEKETSQG